jgi:3-hydroxybutyryl-CoA dehydrogenase
MATKVIVVGAGQMGTGIALVTAARARRPVILVDNDPGQLERSGQFIEGYLRKKHSSDGDAINALISRRLWRDAEEDICRANVLLEAIPEDLAAKQRLLRDFAACKGLKERGSEADWWIGSNTSSLCIGELAQAFNTTSSTTATTDTTDTTTITGASKAMEDNRQRLVGLHFMNPVPIMPVVELVPSMATAARVVQAATNFATSLGKTVILSADSPGFLSNRLLMPFINEAFYVLQEHIPLLQPATGHYKEGGHYREGDHYKCDNDGNSNSHDKVKHGDADEWERMARQVDTLIKGTARHAMGPLETADLIGLDTCLSIMAALHRGLGGDGKYRVCPLLRRLVLAGRLGRKAGHGVYRYASLS